MYLGPLAQVLPQESTIARERLQCWLSLRSLLQWKDPLPSSLTWLLARLGSSLDIGLKTLVCRWLLAVSHPQFFAKQATPQDCSQHDNLLHQKEEPEKEPERENKMEVTDSCNLISEVIISSLLPYSIYLKQVIRSSLYTKGRNYRRVECQKSGIIGGHFRCCLPQVFTLMKDVYKHSGQVHGLWSHTACIQILPLLHDNLLFRTSYLTSLFLCKGRRK